MRKLLFLLTGVFCFSSLFAQLPIDEDFDSYAEGITVFSDWTNDTLTTLNWETEAGTTVSSTTGPSDDASGMGGIYAYIESSSPADSGDQASLCLTASITGSNPALTFGYHMYGASTGSLEVTIDDGTGAVSALLVVGEQQTDELDPYTDAIVPLTSYIGQTITICIIGTVGDNGAGTSFYSDMAIDELFVGELSSDDAEILSLVEPVDGCGLATQAVAVVAGNAGTDTLTSLDVSLSVDGSAPVIETIAVSIAPGESATINLSNGADLSALGSHEIIIDIVATGSDGNLLNGIDTFTVVNAVPASLPVSDDFESYSDGTNVFTDFLNIDNGEIWEAEVGNTGSVGTGPIDAADVGGTYIYIESSAAVDGDIAKLQSPCLDLSGASNPRLDFDYHMFGSSIGYLSVDVVSGGVTTNELLLMGQQDTSETDPWNSASIDLSAYIGQSVVVCISGQVISDSTATTFRGDIALDNIKIVDPVSDDVGATQVSVDPCTGIVKAVVENFGSSAVSSIDVSYSINGGTAVMETISGSLAPGADTCYVFASVAALAAGTSTIDASASATSGDGNAANDAAPQISTTIIGNGYAENFDSYPEAETDLSPLANLGDIDWETEAGPTSSIGTGPSDDATGGGIYIYMETSGSIVGEQAILEFCADLSGMTNAELTYAYHMFGEAVGSLVVMANGVAIDSIVGEQQTLETDPWLYAATDLSAYDGMSVTIQIIGTVGPNGSSFTSDIALDDLGISENMDVICDPSVVPTNLNVNVTATDVEFSWDPIVGTAGCQITGGPTGTFVGERNYYGPDINMVSVPLIKFDAIEYNWKVRCACQIFPSVIATMFSVVDTFDLGPGARSSAFADLGVAPNPATDYLKLNFNSVENGNQPLQVIDLLGRVLHSENIQVNEGVNTFTIDLNRLDNGAYFLQIGTGENQTVKQFEVLK